MELDYHLEQVPLAAIELSVHPFTGGVPGNLSWLTASLAEVGLLSPPWLRRRSEGGFQVVTGRKRLKAAHELGWETIPAFCLAPETPEFYCLMVAVHDNAGRRDFSVTEQAHLASRLLKFCDRQMVIHRYLPLLGMPAAPAYLERLVALAGLEEPFHKLADQGRLALSVVLPLAAWAPEDRLAVLPWLSALPFSQSKQEELLESLELLARREDTTPREVLARFELQEILNQPRASPQEKLAALRMQLRRWLLPRLTAAEAAFGAQLKRLGLSGHPRIRLSPPPAFEGPDFKVELVFRDISELADHLNQLLKLVHNQKLADLLTI